MADFDNSLCTLSKVIDIKTKRDSEVQSLESFLVLEMLSELFHEFPCATICHKFYVNVPSRVPQIHEKVPTFGTLLRYAIS